MCVLHSIRMLIYRGWLYSAQEMPSHLFLAHLCVHIRRSTCNNSRACCLEGLVQWTGVKDRSLNILPMLSIKESMYFHRCNGCKG